MKTSNQERKKKRKEMSTSERLSHLQRGLYQKAKQEPDYRFYILYDKLQLDYVLEESWKRVCQNGGAAGVDGQTIASIVRGGKYKELPEELKEELRQESYRPQAVKRVYIPKANGKERANIKDYLSRHGHQPGRLLAPDLNRKIVGWLNYFTIEKVSDPAMAKMRLRYYLMDRLNRYYKRKSQGRSKLYGHRVFDELVKWGLVAPTKYKPKTPAKA